MQILTQAEQFAYRMAASTNPDSPAFDPLAVTTKLHGEFNDWAAPLAAAGKIGPYPTNLVTHWPYVEQFMKAKYPAAHRGFNMGHEEARPAINRGLLHPEKAVYETGPEAVGKYGYDPSEIAAGMLLLHEQGRPSAETSDKRMLNKIYQNRVKMQQQYDQRQQIA